MLVVDDDADNRDMLAMTLEQCGARVATASSAEEAVRIVEREVPQVLISDIGLPGEDGFSLLRRVRALPRGGDVPAIALTGRGDRAKTLAGAFEAHLTKPVGVDELLATIARVLPGTAS